MIDRFLIPVAYAEIYWPSATVLTGNKDRSLVGLEKSSIEAVVKNILGVFLSLSLVAAVITIIYASYMLITARGDLTVKKKSEDMIVWILVGVVIMLFAYSIVSVAIGLPLFSGDGEITAPT